MNPSLLIPSSPSPTASRPILFSQFIKPTPLRITYPVNSLSRRRRRHSCRISLIRASASEAVAESSVVVSVNDNSKVFGGKKELSGFQLLVDGLPPPVRISSSVIIVAAALAAGYGLGFRFGGTRNIGLAGAAALGAAGVAAVYTLNASVSEVAAVNLHNFVVGSDDPSKLKKEDIEGIAKRYGVSKGNEAFNAELVELYSRFVSSILPAGGKNLSGNEVETIVKFKSALGIDDPDAAAAHMEIGRRIFRERLETGDRGSSTDQRQAFQKLIYVSTLVFGDASTFLLPWKRVFKYTDSQVEVAIRDNAKSLFALKLKSIGRDVDEKQLISLREAQLRYRLSDELAADTFREHTRKLVEENVSTALDILKSRARAAVASMGATQVIDELETILAFNNQLMSLMNHPDAGRFALGIGPISLMGGDYDGGRKMDDLMLLYKAYAAECFSGGCLEENKLVSLDHLKNIFGLGKQGAETIMLDVTSKVYRRRLSQAVSSGDLEAAGSKAAFLQNLCDELHFDPQKASDLHEEIYRQKLQKSVSDGELSEEEVASLLRLRVMLCIPQKTVEAAHADICGSLFEKVVKVIVQTVVPDDDLEGSVKKSMHGLRLTSEAAIDIARKPVRMVFLYYIKKARGADNPTEAAKELRKMVEFNTTVVTKLIGDIKGELADTVPEEPVQVSKQMDEEEWEYLETLKKTRPNDKLDTKSKKPFQTEITVKDDLPLRVRAGLYKTYMMFCAAEDVKEFPFGAELRTVKDDREYLRLNQLGVILGLTSKEIIDIHVGMAEDAFRKEAEMLLADGQVTKSCVDQLAELQRKIGIPPENAQKVIKRITTTKLATAIESGISQGKLDIKQIRELKGSSISLDSMVSERLREGLFKKTLDEIFSSGTGEFDAEEVYENIPADLSINPEKAKRAVHQLASTRLPKSLVQAVSLLRQRNPKGVVCSLNDLLACDKAVPAEQLSWDSPEEIEDLFAIYIKSNPAPEKQSRLQYLFGITDSAVVRLREMGDRWHSSRAEEEEEEFVF